MNNKEAQMWTEYKWGPLFLPYFLLLLLLLNALDQEDGANHKDTAKNWLI